MGASVIKGISRTKNNLLNGKVTNCSFLGFTSHQMGNGEILIQLGQPYIIGSLRLCLYNLRAVRESSFYIETSMDSHYWEMAVDRREERLKSWQEFKFEARPASFIKIIGTYTSATEVRWHFVSWSKYTSIFFFSSSAVYGLNAHAQSSNK